MQKRNYVELPKENGPRFYYREEALAKVKDELQTFLEWDKSMDNITFARKMMYSHELKANNQVEGYQDDLELIEDIIKRKTEKIKDEERKQRILNLYHGYYYILHHKKMDESHLHELYQILSEGLLSEYDLKNMGPLYREKPVYILQNGRLDMELAEGVYYENIEKLIKLYFEFVNSEAKNNQIEEYIKSQIMHFYFVYIHPYFDVNGRTSRTMSMWYLLKKEAYPFIIFNRGISFKGSKYDRVIKDAKESNDMTYFLLMMLETLKVELEKEHVMEMVASNTKYKLNGLDYQTILYFLTMNGNKTLRDFSVMYNRFNDKKTIKEIYNEMIKHLIELEIFIVTRYTKRSIDESIPNMELVLNEKKVEIDSPHLSRIKLK